jgi:hypothetical protein
MENTKKARKVAPLRIALPFQTIEKTEQREADRPLRHVGKMKRGEKILIAIGVVWSLIGILFVALGGVVAFVVDPRPDPVAYLVIVVMPLVALWTVLGFMWILIYGRWE